MKCDIEICVTDDDRTRARDDLVLPASLRGASFGPEPKARGHMSETVTLPHRYLEIIGKSNQTNNNHGSIKNDLASREKDLTTALKWIKQEIIAMKEQDKSLMKQFIDLRSTILHLRYVLEMQGSNSDVSSLSGSNVSLDDTLNTSGSPLLNNSFLSPDYEMTEFRSRTCSLLTPRRPNVTRIKWKSNEFI